MARKPQTSQGPRPSKASRTGFEKMQMSHARMRKDIKRILTERAERTQSGRPQHEQLPLRRGR